MSRDLGRIDAGLLADHPLVLNCSATKDWTDGKGDSVGTTTTSGIYKVKPGDTCIRAISAAADAAAILMLPAVSQVAGKFFYIEAPTGAAAGDISVYDEESGAEISTYGDLDADDDHVILFSTGYAWRVVLDGVA
jgi:hypothetical protein